MTHVAHYLNLTSDVARAIPAAEVTPLTEAFQAVVWHALVSPPALQVQATTW